MNRSYVLKAVDPSPAAVADWLAQNFGFTVKATQSGFLTESNGLNWLWQEGLGHPSLPGLQHVALASRDIEAALAYCREQGLSLDTDSGQPYFNPGIWGKGTRYFNIRTPFGFILEICQRMDLQYEETSPLIGGLEHLGIFSSDIDKAEQFYQSMGFEIAYLRVTNNKGPVCVHCTMMTDGCLMLEVFSVTGNMPLPPAAYAGISTICLQRNQSGTATGPNGEHVELTEQITI